MPPTPTSYRVAARLARLTVPAVGLWNTKIARGHAGRRRSDGRFQQWAAHERHADRPLVWFHAASVGEGLQTLPVLQRVRAANPTWQVAYTFFSPSAEGMGEVLPADVSGYLPYDLPKAVDQILDCLTPRVLIFGQGELWPELATRARARGVRVGMIGATVHPRSWRLRWPFRQATQPGYEAVEAAGAIAESDVERLGTLGVPESVIEVLGDPRYDAVLEQVESLGTDDPLLRLDPGPYALVAGSTWATDEAIVLAAFRDVHRTNPRARLILAPHEPTEGNLRRIESWAARWEVPSVRWHEPPLPASGAVLVDRTGLLTRLYGLALFAYVGGGFGAGLHSVIEPAAWGRPVVFGPRWAAHRDARILLRTGGAADLPARRSFAIERLALYWRNWMDKEEARSQVGQRARAIVERERGAADRCAGLVQRLMRADVAPARV